LCVTSVTTGITRFNTSTKREPGFHRFHRFGGLDETAKCSFLGRAGAGSSSTAILDPSLAAVAGVSSNIRSSPILDVERGEDEVPPPLASKFLRNRYRK
jgi:hypothetical protein